MNMFFLSGLPRSGSTILGSILNQNPDIFVTPTSPLLDLFCLVEENIHKLSEQYTFDISTISTNVHFGIANNFYNHIAQKYIIDKHRGWPKNIDNIKKIITKNPKIICTYRPLVEVITSFVKLMNNDKDNHIDRKLNERRLEINTYNRVNLLWEDSLSDTYYALVYGIDNYRENILLIHYNNIIFELEQTLKKIYQYLEIPYYDFHYSNNIENTCAENDHGWGFKGLHDIRPKLEKTSNDPLETLGPNLFHYFNNIDKQFKIGD